MREHVTRKRERDGTHTASRLVERATPHVSPGPEPGREWGETRTDEPDLHQPPNVSADAVLVFPVASPANRFDQIPLWPPLDISLSAPDDPEEREADQVAREVLSNRGTARPVTRDVQPVDAGIQRLAASTSQQAVTNAIGSMTPPLERYLSSSSDGQPLTATTRSFFEPRFGYDLSQVRIHSDNQAHEAARALNAKAFTAGQHIHFGDGQFKPDSDTGRHLLAHELAHTLQAEREPGREPIVRRNPLDGETDAAAEATGETATALPVRVALQVSFSGMTFTPPKEAIFMPGPKLLQGIAIILRRLIGDAYTPGAEVQLLNHLQETLSGFDVVGFDGSAEADEPLIPIRVDALVSGAIITWAMNQGYGVALSQNQREILAYGIFVENAWKQLNETVIQEELSFSFPEWYGKHIFFNEMSRQGALLREYVFATLAYQERRSEENRQAIRAALNQIVEALLPVMLVVDALKQDEALSDHPGYALLFGVPAAETAVAGEETPPEAPEPAGPEGAPTPADHTPHTLAIFVTFIGSQPELSRRVITEYDEATGRELLDRFVRFTDRVMLNLGDQRITDAPGGANAPPHPATLASYPVLQPPLFDAALGTDHRFTMSLQFPTVFDAFARFAYDWDRIRVPDSAIEGELNPEAMEGETPDWGDVAETRFSRAAGYLATDIERTISGVEATLGVSPGLSATTLAAANGILRFIGTGISLGFEILTTPQYEKPVVFPEEGLYLVRSKAIPVLEGDEEVVRAPSVAYLPVYARSPQEMAEKRVQMAQAAELRASDRYMELQELLSEPYTSIDHEALQQEYEALSASLGTMEDTLVYQRSQVAERLSSLPADSSERSALQDRLDELDLIIEHRRERAAEQPLHQAERLIATFVSDLGQTISLALETVKINEVDGGVEYYISDATTKRSGQETARGSNKAEAIEAALRSLLEGPSGYGRGYCAVKIDGQISTIRIDASEGMLVMEAIENLATVASIAAVAAAPFTGGASLTLLLPIGAVGMIPSGYRLASRAEAGTLELDLETAMEIVNIAGGLAGLGQVATPLRFMRVGRALMVVGVGSDGLGVVLMGADMVAQIEALQDLPTGMRSARIMEILGMALLEAGIATGEAVAARHRQADFETSLAAADPQIGRWIGVEGDDSIRVGGEDHVVRLGVDDGRIVVKLCSSCLAIARRIELIWDRADVAETPGLRSELERIHDAARQLENEINAGVIEPADADAALDDLTRDLNELTANHPEQFPPEQESMSTADDDSVWEELFSGGDDAGEYSTSQRLVRGNLGERLATEWLAAEGHTILSYKPSILGTNQGGIDMVTIKDGRVFLIDNKALTRSGNISSVSALTTNLQQNIVAVRSELTEMLNRPGISPDEQHLIRLAIDALDAGDYVTAVTNANVAPDAIHTTGVSETLNARGIEFIDVFGTQ